MDMAIALPAARSRRRPVRVVARPVEARPTVDDADIIRRVRAGDTDAFGLLVEKYGGRIQRLVRGYVRNEKDAEDVVQDSFVKAFARLDRFDGRSAFFTWLYRIAANTSMDHNKKVRRRPPALPLDAQREDEEGRGAIAPPAKGPTPLQGAMTAELRRSIDEAMASLPDIYREVIVLREMEGLSYDDMSRAIGVSRGTIESRLFRARERLRARLARAEREGA
jgi:RNA polymerase sigma-70 factor (ECF subfamily)